MKLELVLLLVVLAYSSGADAQKLNKTELTATSILEKPFLMQQPNGDFYGYIPDLLTELGKSMGVEINIKLVSDNRYGAKESDGTWNGMVGELTRKEADLAAAPLTITSSRERSVDFTHPYMVTGITMLAKRDTRSPVKGYLFSAFSVEVWICIISIFLIYSFLLFLLKRFSPIEKAMSRKRESTKSMVVESFWLPITTFTFQGVHKGPRSLAGRLYVMAWLLFTMATLALYVGNLFHMPTTFTEQRINSVNDLLKDGTMEYGYLEGGATNYFFRVSNVAVYERLFVEASLVGSTEEGVDRVRRGDYIFLGESHLFDYITSRQCDMMKIGPLLSSNGLGLATPIGSSDVLKGLNDGLLAMRENGQLQKLEKKWFFSSLCEGPSSSSEEVSTNTNRFVTSVDMAQYMGAIYLAVAGFVIAIVVGILETVLIKMRQKA